jgi:hypothetical protein
VYPTTNPRLDGPAWPWNLTARPVLIAAAAVIAALGVPLLRRRWRAAAMVAWMRLRGHGWAATTEMAAAMYVPFVALFPPLWLGVLSTMGLMVLGHVLMVFAMVAVMLRCLDEYTGHHHRQAVPS